METSSEAVEVAEKADERTEIGDNAEGDRQNSKNGDSMDFKAAESKNDEDQLDFEPSGAVEPAEDNNEEMMQESTEKEVVKGTAVNRLLCDQCEFLKFKNIDEWKNHIIGHWRLGGMKSDFQVDCFVEDCKFTSTGENVDSRLVNMGQHFVNVHSFEQAAYRKCDICNIEFVEERKYSSHMKKHEESFQCALCKRKIKGKVWYQKHIEECYGDQRPKWARKNPQLKAGEDKEVLEIYGKEYDVHWGTCTNTFTKETRIVARAWIEGKAWAGKGDTRDKARSNLLKFLKTHVKKKMADGRIQLEDGELEPEPTLQKEKQSALSKVMNNVGKFRCDHCGTQFTKKSNLDLHMFMHRNEGAK